MVDDLDDTVIVPPRAEVINPVADLEDTVVGVRDRPAPVAPVSPSPPSLVPGCYSFRFGDRSEVVALDRPVYLGRRPSTPRVIAGDAPRLVVVPSPLREVSATHLEIRQLGASVIVTDLRSTNGSIVMLPGSVPRKLRQGESVVVSPGTLVDIGDENVLQILPMQRPG